MPSEKLIYTFSGKSVISTFILFLIMSVVAGVLFGAIAGWGLAIFSVFATGLAMYENNVNFDRYKAEYLAQVAQHWASSSDNANEVTRRFDLLKTHGAESVYLDHIVTDSFYENPFDRGSISDNLNQIYTVPSFDFNNPFNTNYGSGYSQIEQLTHTNSPFDSNH